MPAVACDLELLGGPQRFNAFASYASHSVPVEAEVSSPQTDSTDTAAQQPEAVAETLDTSSTQGPGYEKGSPLPSVAFR
ncbi:MAG: hypothetical protein ACK4GG_10350 [Sphingomonas sp.]